MNEIPKILYYFNQEEYDKVKKLLVTFKPENFADRCIKLNSMKILKLDWKTEFVKIMLNTTPIPIHIDMTNEIPQNSWMTLDLNLRKYL